MGRPFRDHRQVVEGIVYRYRTGVPWRDLPAEFGPWQTVWKRHHRFGRTAPGTGCWPRLQAEADAAGRDRLAGVGGLHDRPGAPARRDRGEVARRAVVAHRGRDRMTRIRRGWRDEPDDHAIGRSRGGLTHQDPRCWSTAAAGRWSSSVTPGQAGDSPVLLPLLASCGSPAGPGRPRTDPTRCAATRPTRPAGTARTCAPAASPPSSPNPPTRPATAAAAAPRGGRPVSFDAGRLQAAATSSNAPSTCSSTGAAWPPATTSTPSPTAAASSSPPILAWLR